MEKKNYSHSSEEKNQIIDNFKKRKHKNNYSEILNSNSSKDSKNNNEEHSSIPHPMPLKLNKVKNRQLILSPTVRLGLERECNKDDFYREDDSYIGKGAFGEVWKVLHKQSNKKYVLKVMDKSSIKEQKLSDQINREIEIMYKLNHPHVIRLINHFEDDKYFYLIIPYASKGQLYSLLRRQVRFDQRTAAQYMREVLEAVRYIHSFNPKIIHRDIKPENILLDENCRVLLSDFGWSNFLYDNEYRKTFCGTPEYLSPEMVKKSGHNEMVDIWALGVLLFEFLAGYAPFSGSSPQELYNNIKILKINWPVDFPPLAKNLVSKILKLNPTERLSLEEILDHPWFTQNPPLRHVLTNYLTDEKDILKSRLILVTPESVEEKINSIISPNEKNKYPIIKLDDDDNDEEDSNDSYNNVINNGDDIYLNRKRNEIEEENRILKNKQENFKKEQLLIINQEIKKYNLLSEDRQKILADLEEVNIKNNELILQNELLQNKINLMKKEQEELNNKIIILTKDNNKYISQIEELKILLENYKNKQINNSEKNLSSEDNEKISMKIKDISEKNIKTLGENISPIKLSVVNLEKNIDDLINNKVLSFINDKMKTFDDIINEKKDLDLHNNSNNNKNNNFLFEENKKLIEELTEQKKLVKMKKKRKINLLS